MYSTTCNSIAECDVRFELVLLILEVGVHCPFNLTRLLHQLCFVNNHEILNSCFDEFESCLPLYPFC